MKRISFEIAKALKEAGYPQDRKDVGYVIEKCSDRFNVYYEGELTDNASRMVKKVSAPYVMEVWLWLWREKKISIDVEHLHGIFWGSFTYGQFVLTDDGDQEHSDPEEAIEKAIVYLVENNLIK